MEPTLIDTRVVGSVQFPADKLAEVNKSAELSGGRSLMSIDDGENYVAQFEVFHQLHCLVRQVHIPFAKESLASRNSTWEY